MKLRLSMVAAGLAVFSAAHASAPHLLGRATLSAMPEALAQGDSGPINRVALDLADVQPGEPLTVSCVYANVLVYRCRAETDARAGPGEPLRMVVEIPDLDRGPDVVVRIDTPTGRIEAPVRLVNRPRVLHEIESIALSRGGQTVTDGSGRVAASRTLAREWAATRPAPPPAAASAGCDRILTRWVSAAATDPVFTSAQGTLNGTVVLARAPRRGADVEGDAPEWLITFPLGANRVQFIAHYEIEYRVGLCRERTLPSAGRHAR